MTDEEQRLFDSLTPFRRRVAVGLIDELNNKEIAKKVHSSHGSVRNVVWWLTHKFWTNGRVGIAVWIARHPDFEAALREAVGSDDQG